MVRFGAVVVEDEVFDVDVLENWPYVVGLGAVVVEDEVFDEDMLEVLGVVALTVDEDVVL